MNETILYFQGFMIPVTVDLDIMKENEFNWMVEQVFTQFEEDYNKIKELREDTVYIQDSVKLSKNTKKNFMTQLAAVYKGALLDFVSSLFKYKVTIATSGNHLLLYKGSELLASVPIERL